MLSKTHKNNLFIVDNINKNLYIMIWNAINQQFQKMTLELKQQQITELLKEEFSSKKELVKVNKVVYSGKTSNNYANYLSLLKKYDRENYNNIKQRETIKDKYESDDYIWGGASLEEIEANTNNFNESWEQKILGNSTRWELI